MKEFHSEQQKSRIKTIDVKNKMSIFDRLQITMSRQVQH